MGIMQFIREHFSPPVNKSADTRDREWTNLMNFLGIDPVNQSQEALSEATYFACMKVLCESVGKMPIRLLSRNEKNGVENRYDHPIYYKIHDRPNRYMTASTFWAAVEYNRNHYGNAYVWIQGAGKNMNLWILPSAEVEVWYDDATILGDQPDIYYVYSIGGKKYTFGSEEILHFKTSHSLDGIQGTSVRNQLASSINGGLSSQKMLNKLYESGFTAKATLTYTGSLSDVNVKELTRMTEAYASGELSSDGIRNIIPMPVGFALNPLNTKLADSQFVEVKQYSALQIASAFGIKPYQIGDYTKSSYASAEAQQLSFYVDTLLFILKQYEEELSFKLLTSEEIDNGMYFKFNVAVILRADLSTQINTLSTGVANFIYTPNEARAFLDLEAKEGGDQLLGNGASIPVNLAGSQYTESGGSDDPDPDTKRKGGQDDE